MEELFAESRAGVRTFKFLEKEIMQGNRGMGTGGMRQNGIQADEEG